ncbi:PREDICTED: uncharacterized protein LOC104825227 isoform X1 [Tarenaya hassleriana]|uniref:uncharacterized protein LOC104825227 isoform X1 n=1 Tax=Tarenaya hassleriana TaxID=28532 RepID=UPI00053C9D32|nr:PREDICTED: uncharacterized protein LOC104825227 isoform X1 [Tarenaya hassleriana]
MWDSFLVNHGERRTEMEARERNGRRPQFAIEESGRLLLRASSRGEGQFGVRVCFGSLSLWLSSSTTMSLLAKLSVRNGLLGVGQNKVRMLSTLTPYLLLDRNVVGKASSGGKAINCNLYDPRKGETVKSPALELSKELQMIGSSRGWVALMNESDSTVRLTDMLE